MQDNSYAPQLQTERGVDAPEGMQSYTLKELATILDVPPQTVFEWLLEGRLFVSPTGPQLILRTNDLS